MPQQPTCQPADFFVLRTPGLAFDALAPHQDADRGPAVEGPSPSRLEREREAMRRTLRDLVGHKAVREAVALASPHLASRLEAWLEHSLESQAAGEVERALMKYLSRMSSRSTPFGLFAGVSLGAWGSVSRLALGTWRESRKSVRLDWGVLEAVVDRLERDPAVRELLTYQPNTSLYSRAGWYRYLERREGEAGEGRSYHLEAVEATPHLDLVLRLAQGGARLAELVTGLVKDMAVDPGEARTFLDQVIDVRFLNGDLHPPLTCPDPLGRVIRLLRTAASAAARAEPLAALERERQAIQAAPIGAHPGGYRNITAALGDLGVPPGQQDLLQVDLFRLAPDLALSPLVRRAMAEGAETLRRLTAPPSEGPLDRFRAAFLERYGARWMPLLDVLDEESGLGFDGGVPMDSPLLEGLSFPRTSPPRPLTPRDQWLLKQLPRWQGCQVWELSEADLAALAHPDPQPFPASFAALTSLASASPAALDRGEFQFWMGQYSGATAARWLGRFASGSPALEGLLQSHLRKEEAARPEAVFAEVVHVPEGRMGNVLARPALRGYEIPFLATAGVAQERTILPSELQLTVQGDRVLLASTRLGREVIPRLSSAHNFDRGPGVYRFLAHLQDQDGHQGGWTWGALTGQPFLPRVTRGRHVLSKACWRLEATELKVAMASSREGAWGAFQALRAARGLPRFVVLTEGDHGLLVDLDQVLWVETLHHLVSNRTSFILTECFPEPGQALVTSPEGRFAHELVIPFEAAAPPRPPVTRLPEVSRKPVLRAHPPGSEWLYLKLYCGPASADRLLVDLAPLFRAGRGDGLWDRWHFIRYRDPEHHVRLRFHGVPGRLLAEWLPRLHRHLEGPLSEGLLWKWQIDTFEPELERYGGSLGFDLAEAWFSEDSTQILDYLTTGTTLEERWRSGLAGVDAIWATLGLSLPERKGLAQASRESFRKEFGDAGQGAVQIGMKFRNLRKTLEQDLRLMPAAPSTGLSRIREACDRGLLQQGRLSLAGSLAHMHLNRLLRANPREHEWVLMEFLVRLYESRLAQATKATVTDPD